jgi:endonuclease YncB( thermonuclease family)
MTDQKDSIRNINLLKAILALVVLVPLMLGDRSAIAQTGSARIVDGDTIQIAGVTVRLWGIDAPETKQQCKRSGRSYACGLEAAAHLRDLVGEQPVACRHRTTDRYGRSVAICRVDGEDIGAEMVLAGWAMAFVRYSSDYVELEAAARSAHRGLWAGPFTAPWEWRAAQRRQP